MAEFECLVCKQPFSVADADPVWVRISLTFNMSGHVCPDCHENEKALERLRQKFEKRA